jgi:hypothetical protein
MIPPMQRRRAWLLLGPAVLVSVLAGHELAYRLTGTSEGPTHDYLGHAPQVVVVLALLGLATAELGPRMRLPAAWQLPAAAVATFVVQEHVERLVHTGSVPWLVTSPAFLAGVTLQLPIAFLAWLATRCVVEALVSPSRPRVRRLSRLAVVLTAPAEVAARPVPGASPLGRGPPVRLRP